MKEEEWCVLILYPRVFGLFVRKNPHSMQNEMKKKKKKQVASLKSGGMLLGFQENKKK